MISEKAKNKLLAHHGLDPEKNSDSDLDKKIENSMSQDEQDDLENRAKKYDDTVKELVKADLAKYANRIGKDEKAVQRWEKLLLVNRAETLEMLNALPENKSSATSTQGKQPVHNRREARQPDTLSPEELESENAEAQTIANRATEIEREAKTSGRTITPMSAFLQAESEIKNKKGTK